MLGLGRMGSRIVTAARSLGHDVTAVYDQDENAYGFQIDSTVRAAACASIADFWAKDVDMVAIATFGPTHCPLLIEGLARGQRRFLIEKPLGTSVAEAKYASYEAQRLGARVVVNHGRRYCNVYDRIREFDGSDRMGRLASAVLTMGAGGLASMGTHFFDLYNRIFGQPTSVYATLTTPRGSNPRGTTFVDPGGTVLVHYGERRVLIDMGDDVGVPPRMEFIYQLGRIVIDNELQPWRVLSRQEEHRRERETRYGLPLVESSMEEFVPCEIMYATSGAITDALSDDVPRSGIEVGISSLEVYAALRWSAAIKAPVLFPLPLEAAEAVYPIS